MKTKPTDTNYFDQLKIIYNKKIIRTKRSAKKILEYLKKKYKIIPINLKELDSIGHTKIEEFRYILKNSEKIQINKEAFKIFKLDRNPCTEKYYEYYQERFQGGENIYIYHENETDKLFSNCDLLELKLTILSGIDEKDIQNNTSEYFSYLNTCYHYDYILESLSS